MIEKHHDLGGGCCQRLVKKKEQNNNKEDSLLRRKTIGMVDRGVIEVLMVGGAEDQPRVSRLVIGEAKWSLGICLVFLENSRMKLKSTSIICFY